MILTSLSIVQRKIVADLAGAIADMLPANPHPMADQRISFKAIAEELGMRWEKASKIPSIARLITYSFTHRPQLLDKMLTLTVGRAFDYPKAKLTRDGVLEAARLAEELGIEVKELKDKRLLAKLAQSEEPAQPARLRTTMYAASSRRVLPDDVLRALTDEYLKLAGMNDAQERGFAFERFLNRLFAAHAMNPHESFRVVGEQIDGSFELGEQTYLLEAKWHNRQIGEAELLVFHGKVSGKALWSRGLFVSYGGFTAVGLEAFARGKPTNMICMDGQDLWFLLEKRLRLDRLLIVKSRRAAETNEAYVPVARLLDEIDH